MENLRKYIRNILVEMISDVQTEEERMAEFKKWYKPAEANAAIQEMTSVFKGAYSFEVGSWSNKYDVYEMKDEPEPGCIVRIRIYQMWGQLNLDEIETTPECEGKGYARATINKIKQIAKKHGVRISLEAKAFNTYKGEGRMSSQELEGWYGSQGFVKKGSGMEWKP